MRGIYSRFWSWLKTNLFGFLPPGFLISSTASVWCRASLSKQQWLDKTIFSRQKVQHMPCFPEWRREMARGNAGIASIFWPCCHREQPSLLSIGSIICAMFVIPRQQLFHPKASSINFCESGPGITQSLHQPGETTCVFLACILVEFFCDRDKWLREKKAKTTEQKSTNSFCVSH